MKDLSICVIGAGYVGLVTAACLASTGRRVICCDIDADKIAELKKGETPIYEPGLADLIRSDGESLSFTNDIHAAVAASDIAFIAVGVPMGVDDSESLYYVLWAARTIGESIDGSKRVFVVDKSTVPIGTADLVRKEITKASGGKAADVHVISNPEFLKEGDALSDFMHPDRIVIGADDFESREAMRWLYRPIVGDDPRRLIFMDVKSAEMTKYAANAMLAARISFMNELAQICERVGGDIEEVRRGIGADRRIGDKFLKAGCGYGGSCFPKDIRALIKTAKDAGYRPVLLEAVEGVNESQKLWPYEVALDHFRDLSGKTVAVWGLTFKPNTDDVRKSPAIDVIKRLTNAGANVKAYDPKGAEQARFWLRDCRSDKLEIVDDKFKAADEADCLIVLTEWSEFTAEDDRLFYALRDLMRQPIIIDGRNVYKDVDMAELGFTYCRVGNCPEVAYE